MLNAISTWIAKQIIATDKKNILEGCGGGNGVSNSHITN